jgi:hypothetical protein
MKSKRVVGENHLTFMAGEETGDEGISVVLSAACRKVGAPTRQEGQAPEQRPRTVEKEKPSYREAGKRRLERAQPWYELRQHQRSYAVRDKERLIPQIYLASSEARNKSY